MKYIIDFLITAILMLFCLPLVYFLYSSEINSLHSDFCHIVYMLGALQCLVVSIVFFGTLLIYLVVTLEKKLWALDKKEHNGRKYTK